MIKKPQNSAGERAEIPASIADTRIQLAILEEKIENLRIQYEQFFSGALKLPPDKLNQQVQRELRDLQKKPLKNSALNFKARAVRTRYATLATYWQRVFQARDAGTYIKDVFKANLREQIEQEERRSETRAGKAEKALQELFHSYQTALEQVGGKRDLNFQDFQQSIMRRSKELKERSGGKKVSFKVVVKDGKVTVQAVARER